MSVDQSPSKTGGLMGLCMGMSFVSVAEIIYYCARVRFLTKCSSFIHCNKRLMAALPILSLSFQTLGRICGLGRGKPEDEVEKGGTTQSAKVGFVFLQHFGLGCLRM